MWYHVENSGYARPADVDDVTSQGHVYVRRNITFFEEVKDGEEIISPAHYEWEEMKIPRAMWDVCRQVLGHNEALDDVYAALTELAEMIVEG